MARHGELHARNGLGAHFKGDGAGIVHQNAVAAVGHIEGDIFIGNLGAGAAVFVPDIDDLSVFDERSKALAQTVDLFAHADIELAAHEGAFGRVHIGKHGGAEAIAHGGDLLALIVIGKGGGQAGDLQLEIAGGDAQQLSRLFHLHFAFGIVQGEGGHLGAAALEVGQLHADDIRLRRGDIQLQRGAVQRAFIAPVAYAVEMDLRAVFQNMDFADLFAVAGGNAGLHDPLAYIEFHMLCTPCLLRNVHRYHRARAAVLSIANAGGEEYVRGAAPKTLPRGMIPLGTLNKGLEYLT